MLQLAAPHAGWHALPAGRPTSPPTHPPMHLWCVPALPGESLHGPGGFSERQRQRLGGGRGGPLGCTEAVWEEMKLKTARNQVN